MIILVLLGLCQKDNFSYKSKSGEVVRVGNSVSIRSQLILKSPEFTVGMGLYFPKWIYHEDGFLCAQNYDLLRENGFICAPIDKAYSFSTEMSCPIIKIV